MKTIKILAILALTSAFSLQPSTLLHAAPLGTAFTYQGRLQDGAQPATGLYDLRLTIYDAGTGGVSVGSAVTTNGVAVSSGLFTVTLDFGSSPFAVGQARWLQIEVRTNGAPSYALLAPRQPLAPTPYSLYAPNAGTAALSDRARAGSITSVALAPGAVTGPAIASGAITPALLPTNVAYLDASSQTFTGQNAFNTVVVDPFALNNGAVWSGLIFGSVASGEGIGSKRSAGGNQFGLDFYTWSTPRISITGPGNVGIGTNDPQSALHVVGGVTAASYSGSGSGLSDVWKLGGNSGTTPGTQFLGTTDNQPLEVRVNDSRALRLVPQAAGVVQIIAGYRSNEITGAQSAGSVIAGGGREPEIRYNPREDTWATNYRHQVVSAAYSSIGGGVANTIRSDYSVISGGYQNTVGSNMPGCVIAGGSLNLIATQSVYLAGQNTIGGGSGNKIETDASQSTIAGGVRGTIGAVSQNATIGGGNFNEIQPWTRYCTIAGGTMNRIQTNAESSTIGGGWNNAIGTNALYATIPGGFANEASGVSSFAAGQYAKALHDGSFVWGDATTYVNIASTNANSVTLRAGGGYRLFSNTNATVGAFLAPGGGSWTAMSDRNTKEHFAPVDARDVLDKVAALPLETWNYKSQDAMVRHIGPMAQDFKSAFGLGESDTGITTVDADGVALAAIQGLNQKLEESLREKDVLLKSQQRQIAELLQRLEALEQKRNSSEPNNLNH